MTPLNQPPVNPVQDEMPDFAPQKSNRLGAGLMLLIIGVLSLLNKAYDFLPDELLSWPMVLIVLGLYSMIESQSVKLGSALLVLVGGFFMVERLFPSLDTMSFLVPSVFIVIALFMIFKPKTRKGKFRDGWRNRSTLRSSVPNMPGNANPGLPAEASDQAERLQVNVILGGVERKLNTLQFLGGDVNCALGGVDLDLRSCQFEGTVHIDVTAIMGGVQMRMPSDWQVENRMNVLLGGMEDSRYAHPVSSDMPMRKVILTGTVLMAGVEITN